MLGLGSCLQGLPGYRSVHLYFPAPTHCVQNSSITLPADSRLTALVPSESAIRILSLEDQAFWLQPKMLPELVRAHFLQGAFSEEELARLNGQQVATLSATTHWQIHNISGVRGDLNVCGSWCGPIAAPCPQTRAPRE